MIKPTVGRIVWYYRSKDSQDPGYDPHDQPLAAIITYVHSDTSINVGVFDIGGWNYGRIDIQLWDGEGDTPTDAYCCWMPYQKGQAAKAEALEQQLKVAG